MQLFRRRFCEFDSIQTEIIMHDGVCNLLVIPVFSPVQLLSTKELFFSQAKLLYTASGLLLFSYYHLHFQLHRTNP